jgi:hypothetical protein
MVSKKVMKVILIFIRMFEGKGSYSGSIISFLFSVFVFVSVFRLSKVSFAFNFVSWCRVVINDLNRISIYNI